MIVDDSRFARLSLRSFLAQQRPDWAVVEADSGEQALELVSKTRPDYFSIDLNMPGMDGFELVGTLRKDFPEAPMVLLTANIQTATEAQARELGVACINKPITEESVNEVVERLVA